MEVLGTILGIIWEQWIDISMTIYQVILHLYTVYIFIQSQISQKDYVPHMQNAEKATSLCATQMMCGLPSYQSMATQTAR